MAKSWQSRVHLTLVWLATLGLFMPQLASAAVSGTALTNRIAPPPVVDVAMVGPGVLQGRVSSELGAAQAAAPVIVRRGGETLAVATTDADGTFVVRGLAAGVYEIVTDGTAAIIRIWAPGTAPPVAARMIELRTSRDVVRGKVEAEHMRRAAIIGGVIATAGVLGGVIGYNVRDAS